MRLIKLVTLMLIASVLSSCLNDQNNRLEEINLGSFSVAVDYGPYLIAKNKGWFEDAFKEKGIQVNYTLFQSLPPINEAFATNNIDIVFEAAPPAIVGRAAGNSISIREISCTLIQEILVHNDSSINDILELKGKKIAVLAGTSSHYGLFKILEEYGVNRNEVVVIDMIPPDAKSAFQTYNVDAWAVWPPWVEQEEIAGSGKVLKGGDAFINSIMTVRNSFAENHPEEMKTVTQIIKKTKSWMVENPGESISIIANELKLPKEVIELAWPRHNWEAEIDATIIDDIQNKANFLYTNGYIQNKVDVKSDLVIIDD